MVLGQVEKGAQGLQNTASQEGLLKDSCLGGQRHHLPDELICMLQEVVLRRFWHRFLFSQARRFPHDSSYLVDHFVIQSLDSKELIVHLDLLLDLGLER